MKRMRAVSILVLWILSLFVYSCKKDEPNLAPDCMIVSPSDGDTIMIGSIVQVKLEAGDEDGTVEQLSLALDGDALESFSTSSVTYDWNTESVLPGVRKLKASAKDNEGESTSASIDLVFIGNSAPLAAFTYTPDTALPGQDIDFDASASTDAEDPPSVLEFRWDWDDDGTYDTPFSGDPTATHAFPAMGLYPVTLEVKDSQGLTSTTSKSVLVSGPNLQPPVASFTLSPDTGDVQTTFTVDGTQSYDPDGIASDLQFRWDWDGDGSYDTPYQSIVTASQNYPDTGQFRIRLQVRDLDGLTDTTSLLAVVLPVSSSGQACPGLPTFNYAGQVYNTVQIGSQCWFRENLNIGNMVSPSVGQQNNTTFEKYCYNNDLNSCNIYGGLYQWEEAMAYTPSAQGICPVGWHIATDEDFKYIEGIVDSQLDTLASIWDSTGFRGVDAGYGLKSSSGWSQGGNGNNSSGFTALPAGGAYGSSGGFTGQGIHSMYWTSDETSLSSTAYARYLDVNEDGVYRGGFPKENAFAIRCVRD